MKKKQVIINNVPCLVFGTKWMLIYVNFLPLFPATLVNLQTKKFILFFTLICCKSFLIGSKLVPQWTWITDWKIIQEMDTVLKGSLYAMFWVGAEKRYVLWHQGTFCLIININTEVRKQSKYLRREVKERTELITKDHSFRGFSSLLKILFPSLHLSFMFLSIGPLPMHIRACTAL